MDTSSSIATVVATDDLAPAAQQNGAAVALNGDTEVVEALAERAAEVDAANKHGNTAVVGSANAALDTSPILPHAAANGGQAAAAQANGALSSVLQGFDPDVRQEQLRYGDYISLVPSGLNAVLSFAGARDAVPWAQLLQAEVNMPPNLSDCQVRPQRFPPLQLFLPPAHGHICAVENPASAALRRGKEDAQNLRTA